MFSLTSEGLRADGLVRLKTGTAAFRKIYRQQSNEGVTAVTPHTVSS